MKKLISIKKAAKILDVHPNTLKRWDKSGRLKAIRFGERGDRKYRMKDLENFALHQRRKRKIYPTVGPHIATCALIFKDNKVLLGKRTAEFGKGEFCLVGGSLAFGDSFEENISNEARYKANIQIENIEIFCVTNNRGYIKKHDKQSVTIGARASYKAGKVKAKQQDRVVDWRWYSLDNLPSPIIEADTKIIKCHKQGEFYID